MKENESRKIKSTKDNGHYNIQNVRAKSQSPGNSASSDSDRYEHRRKTKKMKHKKHTRRSKARGNTVNNSDDDST